MSVYTKRISCPVCENLVNIPVYANVNSASMPREAADVASGLAFEKACPVCGNILRLDYAMFYWDPEMKVLLRYDRNLSAVPEEDIYDVNEDGIIDILDISYLLFPTVYGTNE